MTSELMKSVKVSTETLEVLTELKRLNKLHSQNAMIDVTLKLYLSFLIKNYCDTDSEGLLNRLVKLQEKLSPKLSMGD